MVDAGKLGEVFAKNLSHLLLQTLNAQGIVSKLLGLARWGRGFVRAHLLEHLSDLCVAGCNLCLIKLIAFQGQAQGKEMFRAPKPLQSVKHARPLGFEDLPLA